MMLSFLVLQSLVFSTLTVEISDPAASIQVCSGEIRSQLEDKISKFSYLIHRYTTGIETNRNNFNNVLQQVFGDFDVVLLPNNIDEAQSYYLFAGSFIQAYLCKNSIFVCSLHY